jgi:TusA-related sulfurtransferase
MKSLKSKFQARKVDENRYELDVRGLVCPYPQLLVTRALNSLSSEDTLEVILNNPPSVRDIPPALEEKGYKVNVSRLDSSTWKIVVQAKK